MTLDDILLVEIQQAQLLEELLLAIQRGDAVQRDELLQQNPQLLEWVGCLQSLENFVPRSLEPALAPTILGLASPTPASAGTSSIGSGQFGRYELIGEIGRGGMGVVYKARHLDLNRFVALKMILASEWASVEEIARFQAEARAAARLRHRNIVGIHEVGQELGRHFFAMDFVEGQSLSAAIGRKPLPPEQAARWMVSIAQAVEHLHSQGLIHRDLKPSNILIDAEGEPMVTDFGLAKIFDADGGATRTGAILGTPSYMSPEQASGRNSLVGARSDVYSLGAVLYEMLSGRPPFREENPLDTLVQVLEGEATLLTQLVHSIPRELELICFKCLEKDPMQRYASAAELAADLTRYLHGDVVDAQAGGLMQVIRRWARREPGLACRLVLLIPATSLVQLYCLFSDARFSYWLIATSLMGLWMVLSVVWQQLMNRKRLASISLTGSMLTDTAILTALFSQSEVDPGSLLIVYAMLIVASGLWFREKLVWYSTAFVEVAFCTLLLLKPGLCMPWHYPILVASTLLMIGTATSFQVHRVRALSRFYERRPL